MEAAHEDAEIIFGSVIDENMKNKVKITVIATGIGANAQINQVMGGGTILDRPSATPSIAVQAASLNTLAAGTQAASLSSMAQQPMAAPVPPPVPERPVEMRAPMTSPVRSMDMINPSVPAAPRTAPPAMNSEAEKIIPSASLAELDAEMDSFSSDDMVSSMTSADEDLPKPAMAARAPMQPQSAPTPATKMEQVEMFDEAEERIMKEDGLGARARDTRSESLARAQQIARSLGVTNLTDDEYDIPTFIRRQQQGPTVN
jgi:cell division protein FtsZ